MNPTTLTCASTYYEPHGDDNPFAVYVPYQNLGAGRMLFVSNVTYNSNAETVYRAKPRIIMEPVRLTGKRKHKLRVLVPYQRRDAAGSLVNSFGTIEGDIVVTVPHDAPGEAIEHLYWSVRSLASQPDIKTIIQTGEGYT